MNTSFIEEYLDNLRALEVVSALTPNGASANLSVALKLMKEVKEDLLYLQNDLEVFMPTLDELTHLTTTLLDELSDLVKVS